MTFTELTFGQATQDDIIVSPSGSNIGSTWYEPTSQIHFGPGYGICCSKDKATCPCKRANSWRNFEYIVDVSTGANPMKIGDGIGTPCKDIDYKDRLAKTVVLKFQGNKKNVSELATENTRLFSIVSNTKDNILEKMNTLVKSGKNVLIHDEHGYQRAPALLACYLIKYHRAELTKRVKKDTIVNVFKKIRFPGVEAAKLIVADQRPSCLGYGQSDSSQKFSSYQDALDRHYEKLYIKK